MGNTSRGPTDVGGHQWEGAWRLRDYITQEERLRRIGELLLRGVYLWVEATGDAEAAGESLPEAAVKACLMRCQSQSVSGAARTDYLPEERDGFSRQSRPKSSGRRKSRASAEQRRSKAGRLEAMG